MALTYQDLLTQDGTSEQIKTAVDKVFTNSAVGTLGSAISDTIRGINHRQLPNSVPINRDYYGMTFFTRPLLNMRTANLRQIREFTPLLSTIDLSLPRAIRALLDTRATDELYGSTHGCSLVDPYQAFIPLLSNQLISMSGWKDIDVPVFTSKPGAYQESFSMVDGVVRDYTTYDITANFRNIAGDPITALFFVWCHYMSQVFQGNIIPYPDLLIQNEIDYQTRIYRLVLDPSRRFIQKIAATGASFPTNVPIGNAFNFEHDTPINRGNDQITIHFKSTGAIYNDPILVYEFNQTVIQQNSNMSDAYRAVKQTLLTPETWGLFKSSGYPYIDPTTWELQWWVNNDEYNALLGDNAEVSEKFNENEIL